MVAKIDARDEYNKATFFAALAKFEKTFGNVVPPENPTHPRRVRLQEAIDFGREHFLTARQMINTLDEAVGFLNNKVLVPDSQPVDKDLHPNITELQRRAKEAALPHRFPTIFAPDRLGPSYNDRIIMTAEIVNQGFGLMNNYKFDRVAPDAESRFAAGLTDFVALASANLCSELAHLTNDPADRLDLLIGATICEAIATNSPGSRLFKDLDKLGWFTPAYRISPELDAKVHRGQQTLI
ncbi:hypothetical protein HY440_03465 [Candidatus Microgenomates bacterium]|nr:hypothetical protein [Candidatus Microgenomates bacterium]